MPDIFQRQVSNLAGVFTSDRAKLSFGAGLNLGTLVQQMNFGYNQSVARLYEVGSANIYYIGGRTDGNAQLQRIVGPQQSIAAFYQKFGDVCGSGDRSITLTLTETDCRPGQAAGNGATFTIKNPVITSVNLGVAAQQMIITEATTMMYSSLEV